ncbi:hypothetical protein M422DRAFT_104209, partial [Sphaerobolus stellatus SS14]
LPQELLEYIVEDVGEVHDLLSLALTSRAFCHLIIPWHIEYRWISCDIERTNLWKILTEKPHLETRLQKL